VVHHHVKRVVRFKIFGYANQVGVADLAHPLGFNLETLQAVPKSGFRERRVGFQGAVRIACHEVLGTELLDNDFLAAELAAGEINQAESAAAQNLTEGVAFEDVARW